MRTSMQIDFITSALLPQGKQLWHTAFGDSPEFIENFFTTAYAPERSRCITENGQLAAALYWLDAQFEGQKLAYVYAVSTHPDFRNRGLCRRLMADTHELLKKKGYSAAALLPAEKELREMYAKMGYRNCCTSREFTAEAGQPLPIRAIGQAEFTALRRSFLPKGGVIQEGPSLAYLETYAQFYAGEDFLLTAAPYNGRLNSIELLGNVHAAPGILAALGFETGTFRTPGKDSPTVMLLPLHKGAKVPDYWGFVFD